MPDQSLEIQRLREELAALSAKNATLVAEQAKLLAEKAHLVAEREKLQAKQEEMQQVIDDLRSMMAWFRKKLFYKMSEKNLPLDPNVLEPTLFDQSLSEEEQAKLDAEVKAMEERNAKAIEVKAHKRDVRRPVLSGNLPVEETHIYPEGIQDNPDYVEIGVENTDTVAIQPARSRQAGLPDRPAPGDDTAQGYGGRQPSGGHPDKQVRLSPAILPADPEVQGTGRPPERRHNQ